MGMTILNNDIYIGRDEIEYILRNLKMAAVKLANLKKQYDAIKNRTISDAVLLSMAIGNHVLSDMPGIMPEPGEKATRIIDSYRDNLREIYDDTMEAIETEILVIEMVYYQIENSYKVLSPRETIVANEFLIKGCPEKEVSKIAGCSRQTVYLDKDKVLTKLSQAVRIPHEEYILYRGIIDG